MTNPWLSVAISDAILAFSSLFGVFVMAECRRLLECRLPIMATMLAYLLVGTAASLGTLRYGFSPSWAPAHDMMTTAALTLAPSLLASTLFVICFKIEWQPAAWWRLLIGLMAGRELAAQFGYAHDFIMTVNSIALMVMSASAVRYYSEKRIFSVFMFVAVPAYTLASLFVGMGTDGQLAGYLRLDLYHYLLALGHLFSASAVFILAKNESRQ